jgi:hypothetical protein
MRVQILKYGLSKARKNWNRSRRAQLVTSRYSAIEGLYPKVSVAPLQNGNLQVRKDSFSIFHFSFVIGLPVKVRGITATSPLNGGEQMRNGKWKMENGR